MTLVVGATITVRLVKNSQARKETDMQPAKIARRTLLRDGQYGICLACILSSPVSHGVVLATHDTVAAVHASCCEQDENAAPTFRGHARREDRPGGGLMNLELQNLFKGGEGGSLFQITKDALPNHTQQPTTASLLKHVHILCLQFNSHLARDIGAQPDLQDLDKAPSAASAARPPTCQTPSLSSGVSWRRPRISLAQSAVFYLATTPSMAKAPDLTASWPRRHYVLSRNCTRTNRHATNET
ncbi:hypothetical protein Q7P35_003013 [Cladosporium inversicolor]